jgi:hypothetical protein
MFPRSFALEGPLVRRPAWHRSHLIVLAPGVGLKKFEDEARGKPCQPRLQIEVPILFI